MPYSITCFTKILTLTIAPILQISWHPPYIYYGARCVLFTVPSERRGAFFFKGTQTYTFSRTFIKKMETFVYH